MTCTVPHVCYEAWYEPHGNIYEARYYCCHVITARLNEKISQTFHVIRFFIGRFSLHDHVVLFFKYRFTMWIILLLQRYYIFTTCYYYWFFSGRASPDKKGFSDISMQIFKHMPFARACCIATPRMIISQFLVKQWKLIIIIVWNWSW